MTHVLKYRRKTYQLARDAHCFILREEKVKKDSEEKYTIDLGFYKDVVSVIRKLVNLHCLDREDLSVVDSIKTTCAEIKELLSSVEACGKF